MANEGVAHCGQGELGRCEVTCTSSSSAVSLSEVSSSPSGKGKSGVVGMLCHLLQHFGRSIADRSTVFNASPKTRMSQKYVGLDIRTEPVACHCSPPIGRWLYPSKHSRA